MTSKDAIKKVTSNVCSSLIDLFIWQVALVGSSIGKTGPRGVSQAFYETDEVLKKFNHNTIYATWHQLFKKKLLTYKKRNNLYSPNITDYGKKRLQQIFPEYEKNRPWDKRIYLITYDIPEKARIKRNLFRQYLIRINSRLLQESMFINPYNPRQLISGFIERHKIPGTILVSDIGPDGGIGEMTIQDLLTKFYSLDDLNDRYHKFLKNVKEKTKPVKYLIFEYLAILKNDPQLPFPLLPAGWLGDKSYSQYEKLKEIYINSYAAA